MMDDLMATLPRDVVERLDKFHVETHSEMAMEAIDQLLQTTVLNGGKRLRPLLTYLMGNFFGLNIKDCDVLARSVEQVHAASLAHDDVIDNATVRRGSPSINIEGSNKKAVLAGDYLLSDVIMLLCEKSEPEIVKEMAKVIHDLSQGEWIQWEAIDKREYSPEILEKIALKKTASVMSWCCYVPAKVAGLSQEIQDDAKLFGHHIGFAFQLTDDILDFSKLSQKDHGLDLKNNQVNFVMYEWLKEEPHRMRAYKSGESLEKIAWQGDFEKASQKIEKKVNEHLQKARKLLEKIDSLLKTDTTQARKSIDLIVDFLFERAF